MNMIIVCVCLCMCVCECACVRACAHACICVCVCNSGVLLYVRVDLKEHWKELICYRRAQEHKTRGLTCVSLASIHPNRREKSPLGHCMVKIEKYLTRRCVFLYG